MGDAGAVLDLATRVGAVPDQRAASGGVAAGVKKAKTNHPTDINQRSEILSGVCGKWSRTRLGFHRGSVQFPQSPAKVGRARGWRISRRRLSRGIEIRQSCTWGAACLRGFSGEERNGSEANGARLEVMSVGAAE